MKSLKELTSVDVVHVPTHELARAFELLLHDNRFKWTSGKTYIDVTMSK